jgi:hypothetical protein
MPLAPGSKIARLSGGFQYYTNLPLYIWFIGQEFGTSSEGVRNRTMLCFSEELLPGVLCSLYGWQISYRETLELNIFQRLQSKHELPVCELAFSELTILSSLTWAGQDGVIMTQFM